jgi:hypothetical protein
VKPKPSEVKPKPSEVKSKPSEVKSKPSEVKPKPSEVKPKPSEVKSKPSEVKPATPEPGAPKQPGVKSEPIVPGEPTPHVPKVPESTAGGERLHGTVSPLRVSTDSLGKALQGLHKIAEAAEVIGQAFEIEQDLEDLAEIAAIKEPELLPEGTKIELQKANPDAPLLSVPSGYTVEKTNGEVIYRGPDGHPVSRDEALLHSITLRGPSA